jgi:hypothetical protein
LPGTPQPGERERETRGSSLTAAVHATSVGLAPRPRREWNVRASSAWPRAPRRPPTRSRRPLLGHNKRCKRSRADPLERRSTESGLTTQRCDAKLRAWPPASLSMLSHARRTSHGTVLAAPRASGEHRSGATRSASSDSNGGIEMRAPRSRTSEVSGGAMRSSVAGSSRAIPDHNARPDSTPCRNEPSAVRRGRAAPNREDQDAAGLPVPRLI